MSNTTNEAGHLPEGKKKSPLGKWFLLKFLSLNNFPIGKGRNKDLVLTTVSNQKDYSQRLSSEQKVQECDATPADSSYTVWSIKIFLN